MADYVFTTLDFIGLAVPNFLLALILMYLGFRYLGLNVGGLFSPEYVQADWSCRSTYARLGARIPSSGTSGRAGEALAM